VAAAALAQFVAARLTSTTIRVDRLDDVNHYPPLEAPEEVARLTVQFLGDIGFQSRSILPQH